jgi:hypothetical protein
LILAKVIYSEILDNNDFIKELEKSIEIGLEANWKYGILKKGYNLCNFKIINIKVMVQLEMDIHF